MKMVAAACAAFFALNGSALAQSAIASLPNEMIGIWEFDRKACADDNSDTRLTVEAKRVASFASLFKLGAITRRPDGSIKAAATRFDEGEQRRPRASLELKLIGTDKLSVSSDRDTPTVYSRCKTPGKVR